MYYSTAAQPSSAGIWPNAYQISTQQQQAIPAVYYQMPSMTGSSFPTVTGSEYIFQQQQQQQSVPTVYYQTPSAAVSSAVPEVIFQQQQSAPTVYYQAPSVAVPVIATTSEATSQQQQPQTTTTTKSVTTRILDPATLPTIGNNKVIEETTTTTTDGKPELPQTVVTSTAVDVPQITTTTLAPTTINERRRRRSRRLRTLSASTYSDDTTTTTNSTFITQPPTFHQQPFFPPQIPFQATTLAPFNRVVHHARPPSTPTGYYSSDLDYGKRKVYKTDYKYRHYYCCNLCKGRCELRNRSYGCCEWFYGCPIWALIICGLLFLGLLAGFFALFALQPTINPTRRAETAQNRLLNRTQIIYGFYQNCGFQVNATNSPTTLILCTNTASTTTARVNLSPSLTILNETSSYSFNEILIFFMLVFLFRNSGI